MIELNLLPWRDQIRKQQKKELSICAAVALGIALLAIIAIHFSYANSISTQRQRNRVLQNEINHIQPQITRLQDIDKKYNKLLKQWNNLKQLVYQRHQTVQLFNDITRIVPKGVYLSSLERKQQTVTIVGQANSNLLISQLMKSIKHSDEFTNPTLREVTTSGRKGPVITNFKITLQLASPFATQRVGSRKK